MSLGLGKYDAACAKAMQSTGASLILMLVIGGNQGSDLSVQTVDEQLLERLPGLLRFISADIKQDLEGQI